MSSVWSILAIRRVLSQLQPMRDGRIISEDVLESCILESWIDRVLCSQSFSTLFTNVHAVHSGAILSDHYPLFFSIKADLLSIRAAPSVSSKRLRRTDWSKVTSCDIEKYCSMVSRCISPLPADAVDCTLPDCSVHHDVLDSYGMHLVSTLLTCALDCFPTQSVSATRKGLLVGVNLSVG